jgi:hypothetical protein
MERVVRQTIDGEKETLENLLNRVIADYGEESITWGKLIGFFSKRGRLEGYVELTISPSKREAYQQAFNEE